MTAQLAQHRTLPLLAFLALTVSGCKGINFPPFRDDKAAEAAAKDKGPAAPARPGKHSLRIAPYVFLSDFELQNDSALFQELAGLRDQVYKELQLPNSERPVLVYLFEDRDRYEQYMAYHYPKLPKRRAFFVAQPRGMGSEDLLVFTYWGDRIQQDLRHELTHALLHSVLKGVPLWLDEGLAEFFELAPEKKGINDLHLNQLRRSTAEPFAPDLARLERLEEVQQMTPAEYREAWAWTHYFLRGNREAKKTLLAYMQQLKVTDKPGLLRPRLALAIASPEEDVLKHVNGLEFAPRALSMSGADASNSSR